MRRLPLLLVLVVTLAAAWAKAAIARVEPPAARAPRQPSRAQLLTQRVVSFARHQLGVPYTYGGTSRATGFDCSGLVYAAYRSIGWTIPRSSWDQLRAGRAVGFAGL